MVLKNIEKIFKKSSWHILEKMLVYVCRGARDKDKKHEPRGAGLWQLNNKDHRSLKSLDYSFRLFNGAMIIGLDD